MAKLHARGRRTVWRASKHYTRDQEWDRDIARRRREFALMTDGHILRKDHVWWKASRYSPSEGERHHTWGWKLYKKLRKGHDWHAAAERLAAQLERKGFEVSWEYRNAFKSRPESIRARQQPGLF